MRILFLTTELPWPLDGGGKLRTFETLSCLSRFATVEVLAVSESPTAELDRGGLAQALPGVTVHRAIPHPVRIRRRPLALAATALGQLRHGEPYLVAKFRSPAYLAEALRLAASKPDVVWCDHLNVFPAARAAAEKAAARLVLDEHNVESELFSKGAGATGILARLAAIEGGRAARYESEALRLAHAIVAISPDDASKLADMGGGNRVVTCLPSVGDLPGLPPPPPGDTAVFLGTLSWPPNLEAARFLAFEVLPRLRRLAPAARIVIGGRGLSGQAERELRGAGVELAGYVDQPTAFLRRGAVALAPLLSGSGIAMKLLDSLRAGVPTVATPGGARGLALRDGEELLLASSADDFAAAVARAFRDEPLRNKLVEGARAYLAANHSRDALARRYAEVCA